MADIDPVWAEQWNLPTRGDLDDMAYAAAYLAAAIRAGKGRTDVFGLRLMRTDLDALAALIGKVHPGLSSDSLRLGAAFGEVLYIHLSREDKLAQAVSLVKAEQAGLWHVAPDGTEIERLAPPRDPEYDFTRIAAKLAGLERYDAAWRVWFDEQNIAPLHVGYESLSADPQKAVSRICAALGVPLPASATLQPGVAKLSDTLSADWMCRYRADLETGSG